jgi:hypothetical protein
MHRCNGDCRQVCQPLAGYASDGAKRALLLMPTQDENCLLIARLSAAPFASRLTTLVVISSGSYERMQFTATRRGEALIRPVGQTIPRTSAGPRSTALWDCNQEAFSLWKYRRKSAERRPAARVDS